MEFKSGARWSWGLQVRRRHGRSERELWEDDDGQWLGAGHNEHLREVVRENRGQGGVETCREGRGAEARTEVGVVAGFHREDAASRDFKHGVINDLGSASEICPNAHRGDHVGEVDKGLGVRVWECVDTWWDDGFAGCFEDGGDGVGVGDFVLHRWLVSRTVLREYASRRT